MKQTKKAEPDFELCGNCGAVLDKDSLFCKRCGVKLEPKPEADEKTEEPAPEKKLCSKCGAELGDDVKFCSKCGTAVAAEEPAPAPVPEKKLCDRCGAEIGDGDRFCQNCGAPVAVSENAGTVGEAAPTKKFCKTCGTELDDDIKFCHKCGSPADSAAIVQNGGAAVQPQGGAAAQSVDANTKKRRISAILYLIGACISVLLVFIFACTSFISVSVEIMGISLGASVSQNGLGLIGVMFGADSEIASLGVSLPLLRWAGWLYTALVLAIIDHLVCFCINIMRYQKRERPLNLFQSNLAILLAAFGILIVGCIARAQIGDSFDATDAFHGYPADLSCYLGFVGVFVLAVIGFVCVAVAFGYSFNAYPPCDKKARRRGSALAILLVDCCLAVLIALAVIAPCVNMFDNASYDKEIPVTEGDKGSAGLVCDAEYYGVNVGTTVFYLEDAMYGEYYTFTIKTGDADRMSLSNALTLVYYYEIDDAEDSAAIYGVLDDIAVEWAVDYDYGSNYASITFHCETARNIAVVVGFSSATEKTIEYDYSYESVY